MFDPIITDIEPLDIDSSDLDLSVYLELREDPSVALVTGWKDFFIDFTSSTRDTFKSEFNIFCTYWKAKNPVGFTFRGLKACTLANGRRAFYDTPYDASGIVSEQEVGTILYPSRLKKEAEYEMHHDFSYELARQYTYTGPWVSALMVQSQMERAERYEATISWLTKHQEKLAEMAPNHREGYLRQVYKAFWRSYFKAQRANIEKGYRDQSKPLTILQRMDIKHQFQYVADAFGVFLEITWPEGDGPRTLPDILQEKKQELSDLCESGDTKSMMKAEDLEKEIERLEFRLRVDESNLTPWIVEYMSGRERDNLDGYNS